MFLHPEAESAFKWPREEAKEQGTCPRCVGWAEGLCVLGQQDRSRQAEMYSAREHFLGENGPPLHCPFPKTLLPSATSGLAGQV